MKDEDIDKLRDRYFKEYKEAKEELDRELEKFKEMIERGEDRDRLMREKVKIGLLITKMIVPSFRYFMDVTYEIWKEDAREEYLENIKKIREGKYDKDIEGGISGELEGSSKEVGENGE